jgi:tetratricopeptide (TPR) repeat protein
MSNLANTYIDLGKFPEACQRHHETLLGRIEILGPGHLSTRVSLENWMVAETRRMQALTAGGRWADVVRHLRQVQNDLEKWSAQFKEVPEYGEALVNNSNNLAWILATCPDVDVREPEAAVTIAKRAVDLITSDASVRKRSEARARKQKTDGPLGGYWSTLGTCYCRVGQWRDAVEAFEKAMPLRKGGDAYDFFFLAIAHANLANKMEAEKWYAQGVGWVERNSATLKHDPMVSADFERFRAEAAQALGLQEKK